MSVDASVAGGAVEAAGSGEVREMQETPSARRVLISVCRDGYIVMEDAKITRVSQVKGIVSGSSAVKLSIMKSLLDALNYAKTVCDHCDLVLELDNSYIERRISGRGRMGASFKSVSAENPLHELFYRSLVVLEQCDARVSTNLVDRTKAYKHFMRAEVPEPTIDATPIEDAFADLD